MRRCGNKKEALFMIIPGLVSVTFRHLSPEQIVSLCQRAGLEAVEWGGDVHVPPDEPHRAEKAARLCRAAGLQVASYGSYYRAGQPDAEFERVLETAQRLGAPMIRIWAGMHGSGTYGADQRARTVDSLMHCARKAGEKGIRIGLEYHPDTLTDDRASVRRLMEETSQAENLTFYWQPRWDWTRQERLDSLGDLQGRVSHAHVFTWHWQEKQMLRRPLAEGETMWISALDKLRGQRGSRFALLEFVENDEEAALIRDARTLMSWINKAQ